MGVGYTCALPCLPANTHGFSVKRCAYGYVLCTVSVTNHTTEGLAQMNITEIESSDGVTRVHVKGKGIDGIAKVSILPTTIKRETRWDGNTSIDFPAFTTARLVLTFAPNELTVNGKQYDRYEHGTFEPDRVASWHKDVRDMLTDTGVQRVGYRASVGYSQLTDSAREKVAQAVTLAADTYMTTEATKRALVAEAKGQLDDADKAHRATGKALTDAVNHLHNMEALGQ
ncbi:Uncharacterised protein [Mycobacteroides abscessus subsp. bolletii]|nr:Uncharacterised protein [Mycobacteroides abscessus subsp. bolletii]